MKLGDIVEVELYDHALINALGESPLQFLVYGKVVYLSKRELKVAYWISPGDAIDQNTEMVSIIRGAIKRVRKLR